MFKCQSALYLAYKQSKVAQPVFPFNSKWNWLHRSCQWNCLDGLAIWGIIKIKYWPLRVWFSCDSWLAGSGQHQKEKDGLFEKIYFAYFLILSKYLTKLTLPLFPSFTPWQCSFLVILRPHLHFFVHFNFNHLILTSLHSYFTCLSTSLPISLPFFLLNNGHF